MIASCWTVPHHKCVEMRAQLKLVVNVKLANISGMSSVLDWGVFRLGTHWLRKERCEADTVTT